jgi:hypothetical protein
MNMRRNKTWVLCAIIVLSLATSEEALANIGDHLRWGAASVGVEMSLTFSASDNSEFELAFRNIGERDVMLNLGSMLANGKVQLPDRVTIDLTDAQGKNRRFRFSDPNHGGVAGRMDDYIIPLRAGSMYTLTLKLNQFWCPETKEFGISLLPGKNELTAKFEGSSANLINLDTPGIKLMNFWLGKLESNTLFVEK